MFAFTGNPKGVMLTHGNVVADFSGFLKVTDVSWPSLPLLLSFIFQHLTCFFFADLVNTINISTYPKCLIDWFVEMNFKIVLFVVVVLQKVIFPNKDDCLISFLPLAHMFERLIEVTKQTLWLQDWDPGVFMGLDVSVGWRMFWESGYEKKVSAWASQCQALLDFPLHLSFAFPLSGLPHLPSAAGHVVEHLNLQKNTQMFKMLRIKVHLQLAFFSPPHYFHNE